MIKAFFCDIDGCLTDGGYYQSDDFLMKKYHTRDFHGLSLLQWSGVDVYLITKSSDSVTSARIKHMNFSLIEDCMDKKSKVMHIVDVQGKYKLNEIAYIGDDEFDIPLLMVAGASFCPGDAHDSVLNLDRFINQLDFSYVCKKTGGNGCVRECCDIILKINKNK